MKSYTNLSGDFSIFITKKLLKYDILILNKILVKLQTNGPIQLIL